MKILLGQFIVGNTILFNDYLSSRLLK